MLKKWKMKKIEKQKRQMEKYTKPTLEDKLKELERKHGEQTKMQYVDGKLHYYFVDGTEVYFNRGFAGIETVYVVKGFLYDLHAGY